MKILLLADQAEPSLWEHLDRRKLEGVELVLSCGDLPAEYLSFLTCFTAAPILYVHGNHDGRYAKSRRRAASASRIPSTRTTACAFWGWAAACAIVRGRTCTPSTR